MHRTIDMATDMCDTSTPVNIRVLQRSWSCFRNLFQINLDELMFCQICGKTPETVICDGTSVGIRKDFMQYSSDSHCTPQITGSKHKDRVFMPNPICPSSSRGREANADRMRTKPTR